MKSRRPISRRQFIKSASAAALFTPLLFSGQERTASLGSGKSRVILVRDPNVLDENGLPRQAVVQEMLDTGLKALTGQPLNPPGIARAMEEPVKNVTPLLTDMAKEGRITLKGWEGGYPIYALGKP